MNRINNETKKILTRPPEGIKVVVDETNTRHWVATIDGPPDTPYAGGKFDIDVFIPEEYPFRPPIMKFITRIFHSNINWVGQICLDTLKPESWNASTQIASVLLSVQQLLASPNLDDPLNDQANELFLKDRLYGTDEGFRRAQEFTRLYATPK